MTFITFFHSLLSEGIIPLKEDLHIFVWHGNSYGSGKDIYISNTNFTDPLFVHLNCPIEGNKVEIYSFYHEYILEYLNGNWWLTKEWHRPKY